MIAIEGKGSTPERYVQAQSDAQRASDCLLLLLFVFAFPFLSIPLHRYKKLPPVYARFKHCMWVYVWYWSPSGSHSSEWLLDTINRYKQSEPTQRRATVSRWTLLLYQNLHPPEQTRHTPTNNFCIQVCIFLVLLDKSLVPTVRSTIVR